MSKKKVLCAMSGGVDSSVAAALLKRDGYDVIGVFMKFWGERSVAQNFKEAFSAASDVADVLDIPLYTLDFKKDFKKKVVDNFLDEYSALRTPNPCVRCNKFIKLGMVFDVMKKYGADYVASGHYARVSRKHENKKTRKQENKKTQKHENTENTKTQKHENTKSMGVVAPLIRGVGGFDGLKEFNLLKGKDKDKDQSYFLYNLTQAKLKKLLFPIGGYTKSEVRGLAKKFKLPVQDRKESQEVCFTGDHYGFLRKNLKFAKGDIFTFEGEKVGEHNGLPFYTIGQRRGIEIGGTGPYYVVELDFKNNRLIVAGDINHPALMRDFLVCKNVNWVSGQILDLPLKCKAKCRYGQKEVEAEVSLAMTPQSLARRLRRSGGAKCRYGQREVEAFVETHCNASLRGATQMKYLVKFKKPQFAITAGQSVVFYRGDEVLGGGVIES